MDDILLSAKFLLYPKSAGAEVILTNSSITIKHLGSKRKGDETLLLTDVIG